MICQECNKREAVVHLKKVVNNKQTDIALCKQCADKHGFHNPLSSGQFPLADLLATMSKNLRKPEDIEQAQELSCTECQLTFEEFARQGRFGCGACYSSFRPRLEPIMRKIHGNSIHQGRNPGMGTSSKTTSLIPVKEEERVETELAKAIKNEDFERAAELRDKLKSLRQGLTVDN